MLLEEEKRLEFLAPTAFVIAMYCRAESASIGSLNNKGCATLEVEENGERFEFYGNFCLSQAVRSQSDNIR